MSGVQGESFGINSDAYHVPKGVILDWMNQAFDLQLSKIEQCATGAVYCQIIDKLYPGTTQMGKVKWDAKFDYQYMDNYKILNAAFKKNGIQKVPDVDKLIKARYQDNLEFCQWIKKYHDLHDSGEEYDGQGARGNKQMHYILGGTKVAAPVKGGFKPQQQAAPSMAGRPATAQKPGMAKAPGKFASTKVAGASSAATEALNGQIAELKLNNEVLDKEREFYFGKLRLIEEIIQKKSFDTNPMGETVLKILYAGEDEVIEINEDNNLIITAQDGQSGVHVVVNPDTEGQQADTNGADAGEGDEQMQE